MNAQPRILPHKSHPTHHISNEPPPVDDRPRSTYEIITRQMLEDLRSDLDEIKGRVNALLWLTVGAVLLDFLTRLVK